MWQVKGIDTPKAMNTHGRVWHSDIQGCRVTQYDSDRGRIGPDGTDKGEMCQYTFNIDGTGNPEMSCIYYKTRSGDSGNVVVTKGMPAKSKTGPDGQNKGGMMCLSPSHTPFTPQKPHCSTKSPKIQHTVIMAKRQHAKQAGDT